MLLAFALQTTSAGDLMRNTFSFITIILSLLLTLSFQNCGRVQLSSDQLAANQVQVAGELQTGSYNKIIYHTVSEKFDRTGPVGLLLKINLSTGIMTQVKTVDNGSVGVAGTSLSCELDSQRLNELSALLASSRVCQSVPNQAEDLVTCAAQAVSDLQLIDEASGEQLELRANTCNSGVFLCDGLDQSLRDLLSDLSLRLPANCGMASVTEIGN